MAYRVTLFMTMAESDFSGLLIFFFEKRIIFLIINGF